MYVKMDVPSYQLHYVCMRVYVCVRACMRLCLCNVCVDVLAVHECVCVCEVCTYAVPTVD